MTHHQSPAPSEVEECLCRRYPSSQKGGTLIVEQVVSLEEHERLLHSGGYRLNACPRCGSAVYLHDIRSRVMAEGAGLERVKQSTDTQRLRCADRERCGAVWQILPGFLARHLWRRWSTVEQATLGWKSEPCEKKREARRTAVVPGRTQQRWRSRLLSTAALLLTMVASTNRLELREIAGTVGAEGSREQFVVAYARRLQPPPGQRLSRVAGVIH